MTDKKLIVLENRIAAEYKKAAEELQEKIDAYFEQFKERDKKQKNLIGTVVNGKEYTEQDYKQWRIAQIGRGKRFEALRDRLAERMTKANEVAAAYINDKTPGIYSLNRNYAAYTIEAQVGANVGLDLWDEQTVKRLIVEQPDLMPYYPPERAVKRGIDLAWGKRQITAQVTSGILQGESIKHLADRLQTNIPNMNRDGAIRAARTSVTGAQNAGRMDSYHAAEKMGIKLKKEWLATLDNRTRHSHAMLDGVQVDNDKAFPNGCKFPGDPSGPGHEVYNCRCTMIAAVKGVDTSDAKRRAIDPQTGKSVVIGDMSYKEWAEWKKKTEENVEKSALYDTMEKTAGGGSSVQTIGKIDPKTFSVVSPDIITSEVIITDERIMHIKERHPNDFESYSGYISDMLSKPQYILADNVPETAVILQEFADKDEHFRLILKLAVSKSPKGMKNSVITFLKISEKKFKKYLRNKKILYKSE